MDFLFKPKTNVLYKSKFRISIEDGLYYDIVVRGRGSFEEELEVKWFFRFFLILLFIA